MKTFTDFIRKIKNNKFAAFAGWTALFYVMLMVLYLYLMYANLSTAPKFVYNMF